eukprot:scaffold2134_cov93-Cylindrotheca_fusiformis.AAC.13
MTSFVTTLLGSCCQDGNGYDFQDDESISSVGKTKITKRTTSGGPKPGTAKESKLRTTPGQPVKLMCSSSPLLEDQEAKDAGHSILNLTKITHTSSSSSSVLLGLMEDMDATPGSLTPMEVRLDHQHKLKLETSNLTEEECFVVENGDDSSRGFDGDDDSLFQMTDKEDSEAVFNNEYGEEPTSPTSTTSTASSLSLNFQKGQLESFLIHDDEYDQDGAEGHRLLKHAVLDVEDAKDQQADSDPCQVEDEIFPAEQTPEEPDLSGPNPLPTGYNDDAFGVYKELLADDVVVSENGEGGDASSFDDGSLGDSSSQEDAYNPFSPFPEDRLPFDWQQEDIVFQEELEEIHSTIILPTKPEKSIAETDRNVNKSKKKKKKKWSKKGIKKRFSSLLMPTASDVPRYGALQGPRTPERNEVLKQSDVDGVKSPTMSLPQTHSTSTSTTSATTVNSCTGSTTPGNFPSAGSRSTPSLMTLNPSIVLLTQSPPASHGFDESHAVDEQPSVNAGQTSSVLLDQEDCTDDSRSNILSEFDFSQPKTISTLPDSVVAVVTPPRQAPTSLQRADVVKDNCVVAQVSFDSLSSSSDPTLESSYDDDESSDDSAHIWTSPQHQHDFPTQANEKTNTSSSWSDRDSDLDYGSLVEGSIPPLPPTSDSEMTPKIKNLRKQVPKAKIGSSTAANDNRTRSLFSFWENMAAASASWKPVVTTRNKRSFEFYDSELEAEDLGIPFEEHLWTELEEESVSA